MKRFLPEKVEPPTATRSENFMHVVNIHVGLTHLSSHALERWRDRGNGEGVLEHLRTACPFGAQRGAALMLASGNCVFVTELLEGGERLVTTVLTRDQATANVLGSVSCKPWRDHAPREIQGTHEKEPFVGGLVSEADPAIQKHAGKDAKKKQAAALNNTQLATLQRVWCATDEQLEALAKSAGPQLLPVVERERLQRKRIEKHKKHGELMNAGRWAARIAIKRIIPEERLPEAYRIIDEEEQKKGLK